MRNRKHRNLVGMTFGKLSVIKELPPRGASRSWRFICRCTCGSETEVLGHNLTKNNGTHQCRHCPSNKLPAGVSKLNSLYGTYIYGARTRGHVFELSKEIFIELVNSPCTYCGGTGGGIDRVNNALGYTESNSVPCCKRCNLGKHALPVEEFIGWIKRIYENQLRKGS